MNGRPLAILLVIVALLAGCAGGVQQPGGAGKAATTGAGAATSTGASTGDAANGDKLFHQAKLGTDAGCATCHSTEPDKVIVGPSLAGIATDAAQTPNEEGYEGKATNAAEFLREAIVNPDVDVASGFQAKVMPQDFGKQLTEQQINDLVAYLLTLK